MKKLSIMLLWLVVFPGSFALAHEQVVVVPLSSTSKKIGTALMSASVNPDGTLARGTAGVTSSKSMVTGTYVVCFPQQITSCQYLGSPGGNLLGGSFYNRAVGVTKRITSSENNCVYVNVTNTATDANIDDYFTVLVHCP